MEEIIRGAYRLLDLAELPESPMHMARIKELIEELGSLMGAA
jgi:hypothetical protein